MAVNEPCPHRATCPGIPYQVAGCRISSTVSGAQAGRSGGPSRRRPAPFDARGLSCPGWTWNPWDRSSGPSLISGYDGTPTAFGTGLRDRLRAPNG